ncbi:MAG TPA: hypothetical protein VMD59_19870, partial [Acidimicrobiales bacterium]|nr:hypothetical protein [Acidimicrobiales bacterium]
PAGAPAGRSVVLCQPVRERLVVGSSQRPETLAPQTLADHPGLVRRRSGGAAVLVSPRAQCWVDVFVPSGDELLHADVARSAWWLGEAWARALAALLGQQRSLGVHRGPSERTPWSAIACFAALGPGEVTIDGRKVVGISQRRNSGGAWLHSMALLRFDATRLARLLCPEPAEAGQLAAELAARATTVDLAAAALEVALLEQLPGAGAAPERE